MHLSCSLLKREPGRGQLKDAGRRGAGVETAHSPPAQVSARNVPDIEGSAADQALCKLEGHPHGTPDPVARCKTEQYASDTVARFCIHGET